MKRFWEKVDKKSDCWIWNASKNVDGYGQFRLEGTTVNAHRIAWMLTNGPIPNNLLVLHHCDNPPCVNPNHLFIGTHQDNMADRDRKGRNRVGIGERHGLSKLTDHQAKEIKTALANGETHMAIAIRFPIGWQAVGRIARGETWKHINLENM